MIFDTLLLFCSLVLLCSTSIGIIIVSKIKGRISIFLAVFILSWTQIVTGIELLSIFKIVKPETMFVWHILLFLIVLFYMKQKMIQLPKVSQQRIISYIKEFNLRRLDWILIISILFIFIITLFTALKVPPNNWDSMTYHMSRAAYWYQYGTIDHFFTINARQTTSPIVAETGILWTMLFAKTDSFANMIQWSSLIASSVALYGVCSMFDFSRRISLMTTLTYISLPMVILQASTTQNDLVTAAFIMIAIYFTYAGLRTNVQYLSYLLLAGLSLGLAIGAKGYALFMLPGLFIFILSLILKFEITEKKEKIISIAWVYLLGILLFSTYNWIENIQNYGSIFGGASTGAMVVNPNLETFILNSLHMWASFFDLPITYFQTVLFNIVELIHSSIGIDISPERITKGGEYTISQVMIHHDSAYFGPLGFFLVWPSIIGVIAFTLIKKFRKQQINDRLYNVAMMSFVAFSFFMIIGFLIKWSPWRGRYMISFIITGLPSVAYVYHSILQSSQLTRRIFTSFIVVAILFTSFFCLFLNYSAPIIPIGYDKSSYSINDIEILPVTPKIQMERSILKMNETDLRFINYPSSHLTFELVNQRIPHDGRLGLMIGGDDWDYPLFGEGFEREIIQIPVEILGIKGVGKVMQDFGLDGMLYRKDAFFNNETLQKGNNFEIYESGDFILLVSAFKK